MIYSKIDLSGPTIIERSVPLPAWLDGIGASEDQIRDCGWAGHEGVGFWPEAVTDPALDPATEALTDEIVWAEPDEQTRTVTGARAKRALTPEEIAARQPRPRVMSKMQFIRLVQTAGGMTDALLAQAHAEPLLTPFWIKFNMTAEMQRDDIDTQAGLGALAALGLLPNGTQAVIDAWPPA